MDWKPNEADLQQITLVFKQSIDMTRNLMLPAVL